MIPIGRGQRELIIGDRQQEAYPGMSSIFMLGAATSLFNEGIGPAINVGISVSRVGSALKRGLQKGTEIVETPVNQGPWEHRRKLEVPR
jgi:F0F1-type ATP synthase alpha subunit